MEKATAISGFRDLRVWQSAMDLVERVYRVTHSFPKEELYGLTSQLRRAAVSIPSNVAEGHTRKHSKEFLQHLSMAQASLAEVQTQLEIAFRLHFMTNPEFDEIVGVAISLAKQLYALRNAIRGRMVLGSPSPNP